MRVKYSLSIVIVSEAWQSLGGRASSQFVIPAEAGIYIIPSNTLSQLLLIALQCTNIFSCQQ